MSQEHGEATEHTTQHFHHHACANLFGCGDEKGVGIFCQDMMALWTVAPPIGFSTWMKSIREISTPIFRYADAGAASSSRQVASWAASRPSALGSRSFAG